MRVCMRAIWYFPVVLAHNQKYHDLECLMQVERNAFREREMEAPGVAFYPVWFAVGWCAYANQCRTCVRFVRPKRRRLRVSGTCVSIAWVVEFPRARCATRVLIMVMRRPWAPGLRALLRPFVVLYAAR